MEYSPKVSIVIPVYNGSNYLRHAIDSALAQTYKNVEVVVVNDGSNDGGKTEAIVKSYGDRIRYVWKPNEGVASALNQGIREMTGEWFSWLSHDDTYYPEKIEKQIKLATSGPDIRVVVCNTGVMDAVGRTIAENNRVGPPILRGGLTYWELWLYACSLLVHKSCFDVIGLLNESNRTTQDMELVLMLLHHFDVYHLPEILVRRRDHVESGTYVLSRQNEQDYNALIQRLIDEYGIGFFFPDVDADRGGPRALAAAYGRLGDFSLVAVKKRCSPHWHRISVQLWPSPLNPSCYKLLLGPSVLMWWGRSRVRPWLVQWGTRAERLRRRAARGTTLIRHTLSGHPLSQWPGLLRNLWIERQQRLGKV
jgi:glycosyltransferase involved in cell wall biosynthesis